MASKIRKTKTLHLNLKKEYFDQIKLGHKKEEYRIVNDFWQKRIEGREYDRIFIKLGYPKSGDKDKIIVFPWNGYQIKTIEHELFDGKREVYAIKLKREGGNVSL